MSQDVDTQCIQCANADYVQLWLIEHMPTNIFLTNLFEFFTSSLPQLLQR